MKFLFILYLFKLVSAHEVTLLDTTTFDSLNWQTHIEGGEKRGWREASYRSNSGDVIRVYTVCQLAAPQVKNWLRTPFVPRNGANRLHVQVRFTMRKCTKFPSPDRLQQCKESFKLLYSEVEEEELETAEWDEQKYKHADVIPAMHVFVDNTDAVENVETRSVPIRANGAYFVFYDEGACLTILSVRIFFIMCDPILLNYAHFNSTHTGQKAADIVQSIGTCVPYSKSHNIVPTFLCKADGTWDMSSGRCDCIAGYEGASNTCYACPLNTYKSEEGSSACILCPGNSAAIETGAHICPCVEGYFRSPHEGARHACTKPPSRPLNLRVGQKNATSFEIMWEPPSDLGGRSDIYYLIECPLLFIKIRVENRTSFLISNVKFNTQYDVTVYAGNDVSNQYNLLTSSSYLLESSSITVNTSQSTLPKISKKKKVPTATLR